MTQTISALLGQTWFAADMPADACERLAAIGEFMDYPTGSTVLQEGAPCRALGVVLKGRIALRLALPGAGERTIITVDDGDLFGWSALLPEPVATSTGVTLVPTSAVMFERERLVATLAADRDLAAAMYPRVLVAVARRLAATRLQLLDVYRAGTEPW
jgi:CRP/FNR family transcriptional regulator, cyclic AMP receptor protein